MSCGRAVRGEDGESGSYGRKEKLVCVRECHIVCKNKWANVLVC